jgi:hypothetical protein
MNQIFRYHKCQLLNKHHDEDFICRTYVKNYYLLLSSNFYCFFLLKEAMIIMNKYWLSYNRSDKATRVQKEKTNNTERTCSQNHQTKKTNKNKNTTKIKIAVQHVQTIEQEKKKQSKCLHTTLFRNIREKQTNQQALTITKYWQIIYIYMKKNKQFSRVRKTTN